jgi:hypothetical protein
MADGFKTLPKMQHFKEGGHAKAKCSGGKMKKGGEVKHDDVKEDKKLIKKAFGMHDKQLHEDEKTDLSTLKKGGRAKKEKGTVKKFKAGGSVANEAKKPSGDAVKMEKTKVTGDKRAKAPSKAATKANLAGSDVVKTNKKPAGDASKLKKVVSSTKEVKVASAAGKGDNTVKKFADGGSTGDDQYDIGRGVLNAVGKVPVVGGFLKNQATDLRNKILGTPEQNRIAQANMDRIAARNAALNTGARLPQAAIQGAMAAKGLGTPACAAAPTAPVGQPTPTNIGALGSAAGAAPVSTIPGQKRGGRAGKR